MAKPLSLAVITLLFLIGLRFFDLAGWARHALTWMKGLGSFGPLALIALYILACLTFFPGVLLTMGAGILYGVFWGSIYVMIGATLGAASAFLVARYAARDWMKARIGHHPKFQAIDRAISREGWKIVGLIRLSPVLPFILLNFLFGLTGVSFAQFFIATFLGISPAIILFVYIGTLLGDLTKLGTSIPQEPWARAVGVGGLVITIIVSFLITQVARRALAQRLQPNTATGSEPED